jgi:hypothetical protein
MPLWLHDQWPKTWFGSLPRQLEGLNRLPRHYSSGSRPSPCIHRTPNTSPSEGRFFVCSVIDRILSSSTGLKNCKVPKREPCHFIEIFHVWLLFGEQVLHLLFTHITPFVSQLVATIPNFCTNVCQILRLRSRKGIRIQPQQKVASHKGPRRKLRNLFLDYYKEVTQPHATNHRHRSDWSVHPFKTRMTLQRRRHAGEGARIRWGSSIGWKSPMTSLISMSFRIDWIYVTRVRIDGRRTSRI